MQRAISICVFGCVLAGLVGAGLARAECDSVQVAKLIAGDAAAGDTFAYSVALDGDTAVVGAYLDDLTAGTDAGSAYVFVRSDGAWSEHAKLVASDAASLDYFGRSVALDGDTALVGADGDTNSAGSVYVFVHSDGVWTQQAKLTAADAAAGDQFGIYVALDGDTAVIGACRDDHPGATDAGSAYVFVRSNGTWTQQAKLTAADAAAGDRFGVCAAVDGDTALVGAYYDSSAAGSRTGSAYVFVRSEGVWAQQAKLTADDASEYDYFGASVALDADRAVVGAYWANEVGAAYVFSRSGTLWTQQARLTAVDGAVDDLFGRSVAVDGDIAVVGAYRGDHSGSADAGAAYVFTASGGVWTQQAKLTAEDAANNDWFAWTVALEADTAIIGASLDDHPSANNAGSAYVFDLGCLGDPDSDGLPNYLDNCPGDYNPEQEDCNGNGVGDACDLCGALDADSDVDVDDYFVLVAALGRTAGDPLFNDCADYDGDGVITFIDYQEWLLCYQEANGRAFMLPRRTPAAAEPADSIGPRAGEAGGARPLGR